MASPIPTLEESKMSEKVIYAVKGGCYSLSKKHHYSGWRTCSNKENLFLSLPTLDSQFRTVRFIFVCHEDCGNI
ncbi:hypothetical protein C0J52_09553 [Blattella germanica]|nr:hypothetical protein C0J52_09553 [Blattella germanica]